MSSFFNSIFGFYLVMAVLNVVTVYLFALLHKGKQKLEEEVTKILPADEATKVNDFLDTVERLVEASVLDKKSRIVDALKAQKLFTPETAAALKQSVISDVMNNLGPLKEKGMELVGPLENIVGQLVEKYVVNSKKAG